jgi:DNA primase
MDVITLHQAGFTNAVAALGTAFTPNHALLIKRYVSKVVLTFDSDGAGVKAALRAIPILKEAGLGIKVLNMKPYKDPDEFIKNLGQERYQERIDQAQNAFLFEIACMKNNYDLNDPDQKNNFYDQIARRLLSFSQDMERNIYMEAVCKEQGIDYGVMKKTVNALGAKLTPAQSAYEEPKPAKKKVDKEDGIRKAERLLLTWITEEPAIYEKVADIITAEDFSTPLYKKTAELIIAQAETGSVNPGQILNAFINDEEEYKAAAALFQMQLPEELSGPERSRALTETVVRIKRNSLEQASKNVTDAASLQEIIKAMNALQKVHITLD